VGLRRGSPGHGGAAGARRRRARRRVERANRGLPAPDAAPSIRRRAPIHEPAVSGDQPVSSAARAQPGQLVPVGRRGVRGGPAARAAGAAQRRVLDVSLVSRDGGGVVRRRRRRPLLERALHCNQGRPRGAAGRRRGLHERGADAHGQRRLADDRVADPGSQAVLRRDVLPAARRRSRRAPRVSLAARAARQPVRGRARTRGRGRGRPRQRDRSQPVGQPRRGSCRRGDPGSRGVVLQPPSRHEAGRDAGSAQVSEQLARALPAAPSPPHRGPGVAAHRGADAGADGGGRDLRPGRRRIPPLLHRRAVAGPALREDAVRQRAFDPRLPRRLPVPRARRLRRCRPRDSALPSSAT